MERFGADFSSCWRCIEWITEIEVLVAHESRRVKTKQFCLSIEVEEKRSFLWPVRDVFAGSKARSQRRAKRHEIRSPDSWAGKGCVRSNPFSQKPATLMSLP